VSSILNPPCFWFDQGKCNLTTLPCAIVLGILRSNAKAREDFQNCAGSSCPPPDPFYVNYLEKVGPNRDATLENDAMQRRYNTYRDLSRVSPGAATPLPRRPSDDT
jgi:hypothetical protein